MTGPLYNHLAFSILPKRGLFNPSEILAEWEELIAHTLKRHHEPRTDASPTTEDADALARDLYLCSARDVAILVPIIAGDDEAERQLHALQDRRDALRQLIS